VSVDMSTKYLGLNLAHPIVPSASPLTGDIDRILALADAGAPAVVLLSIFEEQIEHDLTTLSGGPEIGAGAFGEAPAGYLPRLDAYNTGTEAYLELIRRAKDEAGIPVIGSLNGITLGGWTHYARDMAAAGVDALELNIYRVAAGIDETPEQVESDYLRLVEAVRSSIDIPLAVKVGPYFTAMASMARRFADAGADGLVLFNRFYQPDIDLESLSVVPNLVLSTSAELRLILRWTAIIHGRVDIDLAATTGIHQPEDAVKALLAGASAIMMASALLRHGPDHLSVVRDGLADWLAANEYASVDQARGSLSQQAVDDPAAFERANYMKSLASHVPTW
jgi:dihydroorotate dehydrogenase (fumarate)